MSEIKITRRDFVKGAAVAAAATAAPLAAGVTPAFADPGWKFPIAASQTEPWVPLDPQKLARYGWEIYRSRHAGQGG